MVLLYLKCFYLLLYFIIFILYYFILCLQCLQISKKNPVYRILWKEAPSTNNLSVNENRNSYFAFALLASIITICVCLVILVMRKQIQLVIQLFREAGRAISAMPLLLLQPTIVSDFNNIQNNRTVDSRYTLEKIAVVVPRCHP